VAGRDVAKRVSGPMALGFRPSRNGSAAMRGARRGYGRWHGGLTNLGSATLDW